MELTSINTRSALRDLDSANFVRVRAWSVGDPSRKNTVYQVSAPILIAISQASSVGGLIATRLLRAVGNAWPVVNFLRPLSRRVQPAKQTPSVFNILWGKSSFVSTAVSHGVNHEQGGLKCLTKVVKGSSK